MSFIPGIEKLRTTAPPSIEKMTSLLSSEMPSAIFAAEATSQMVVERPVASRTALRLIESISHTSISVWSAFELSRAIKIR
jgi:hypothetical protein